MIKARACAGDIAAGEALLRCAVAVHLAQIHRLRGARRHPRDEAADPRLQGTRRDRGRRPQHQARPRRHPRDRILRADPAADRRRPASGIARPPDARNAGVLWPKATGSSEEARRDLEAAYRFLRRVEHRLQMVADEQTHTLPAEPDSARAFRAVPRLCRRRSISRPTVGASAEVQRHYSQLFEQSRAAAERTLVFPKDADDRDTLDQLAELGFRKPLEISATRAQLALRAISGAARRIRTRRNLPSFVPPLLEQLARSGKSGSGAAWRSTASCRGLHAGGGGRLFSLLRQNPDLLALARAHSRQCAAARRYSRAPSAGDGRADRSGVFRRAAGRRDCSRPNCRARSGNPNPTRICSIACACSDRSTCS